VITVKVPNASAHIEMIVGSTQEFDCIRVGFITELKAAEVFETTGDEVVDTVSEELVAKVTGITSRI